MIHSVIIIEQRKVVTMRIVTALALILGVVTTVASINFIAMAADAQLSLDAEYARVAEQANKIHSIRRKNKTLQTELHTLNSVSFKRDFKCMTENIYYEASTEPIAGKYAVGFVVLNRVASAHYPNTACKVINQRNNVNGHAVCQFSWNCIRMPRIVYKSKSWRDCKQIARKIMLHSAILKDITGGALHYHNTSVHPYWANSIPFKKQIGAHLFYS